MAGGDGAVNRGGAMMKGLGEKVHRMRVWVGVTLKKDGGVTTRRGIWRQGYLKVRHRTKGSGGKA